MEAKLIEHLAQEILHAIEHHRKFFQTRAEVLFVMTMAVWSLPLGPLRWIAILMTGILIFSNYFKWLKPFGKDTNPFIELDKLITELPEQDEIVHWKKQVYTLKKRTTIWCTLKECWRYLLCSLFYLINVVFICIDTGLWVHKLT